MTTIVPTSDKDAALSVVRFSSELAWADAGPEVAESQVNRLCMEAQEFIVMRKWSELASLMVTSAELRLSKVSEKEMSAIRLLEKDVEYASVYQLLEIFLTQRLDAYLDFHAANAALLKSYGLVHEECIA